MPWNAELHVTGTRMPVGEYKLDKENGETWPQAVQKMKAQFWKEAPGYFYKLLGCMRVECVETRTDPNYNPMEKTCCMFCREESIEDASDKIEEHLEKGTFQGCFMYLNPYEIAGYRVLFEEHYVRWKFGKALGIPNATKFAPEFERFKDEITEYEKYQAEVEMDEEMQRLQRINIEGFSLCSKRATKFDSPSFFTLGFCFPNSFFLGLILSSSVRSRRVTGGRSSPFSYAFN